MIMPPLVFRVKGDADCVINKMFLNMIVKDVIGISTDWTRTWGIKGIFG